MTKHAPLALAPMLVLNIVACSDVQAPATPSTSAAIRAVQPLASNADNTTGRIEICHRTSGTTAFILISIAPSAVDAHLAHGDGRIGEPLPGQPGMRFGPDCQPEPIAFHVTITPTARGFVRDTGSNRDGVGDRVFVPFPPLIQVFNTPDYEDRGIVEFSLSTVTQPVSHAELRLPVNSGPFGQFPSIIEVYVYPGDGAVTLGDFAAGTAVAFKVFSQNTPPPAQVTFDVTTALNSLIGAHAPVAGFNLRHSPFGGIVFDAFDPSTPQAGPTPVLDVQSP